MTVSAPPRPPRRSPVEPEALFAEARRHRQGRRLRLVAVSLALIAAGVGAYWALAGVATHTNTVGGGSVGAAPPDRVVVLLVDVSGSMRADDVKPTRLDAAVTAMRALLARLPRRIEVALVSFSTSAQIVVPATLDRARLRAGLETLTPQAGTALGDGLETAIKLTQTTLTKQGIARIPSGRLPATIVLESDGGQNRGAVMPNAAAEVAKHAGIRVDAIALGTADGSVALGIGRYQNRVPVPPDPKAVAQIAALTGGRAYTATNTARLITIYRSLGSTL